MATSPMVGGADPAILKSLEAQTPSVARTSPATVNAVTGAETSTGGTVSRGLVPQVSGGTVTYNQATQATAGNSVTVTSSTSNDPGDVVTIYTSPKAVSVSSVNQTVNTYKVNNYAGNEYTDSDVANYLPTFTGNVGAGNVNATGGVYTYNLSSTGLSSLTTLTVSATSNLGAVGNVRITGGTAGQVLSTNGSGVLSWVSDATTYGNSNVVSLMGAFGSNTISTTGLITGNGGGLSNVPYANVTGTPTLGNISTINLDGNVSNLMTGTGTFVAIPTVPSFGNIATINLDGNVSNLMTGTGTFVAIPTVPTVGNIATINLDGNVSNVLRGDGTWGADANSAYGDSNVVSLMGAFGSNTITTTGNITGGNIDIPNGRANVTGNANTVGGGATVGVRSILAIDSAFGSNDANDPASAQAVRGRVTGSNLTKTRNYVAGVTGQYLVTGTNASEFINTGLLGVVGDQTTTANAAVVAYLDGDGGLTTAGSAYGVSMKNSTPGSGFDYGLDLQFINLNVAGTTTPFKQADIRFNNGVTLVANTAGNISINANVTVGNIIATNIGNIATINLDGNVSNILYGNGVFASAPAGGTYGDSNVVTLLGAFGSNTIVTTGNANVGNLNVTGTVKTGVFVTGNIPAAATAGAGARAFVTDATVATFGSAYVGGAANAVPVYSDGTGWFIG